MKVVLFLSSCVVLFVGAKVYSNKKLQNELYVSLCEMNKRLEDCMKERTPELVNELPQSRSPSPSPVLTDASTPHSFTMVTENLCEFS